MPNYRNDILFDYSTGDLFVNNGTVVYGDSNQQSVGFLLEANKGDYKQFVNCGVGIFNYLNAPSYTNLNDVITEQLTNDGFQILELDVSNPPYYVVIADKIK